MKDRELARATKLFPCLRLSETAKFRSQITSKEYRAYVLRLVSFNQLEVDLAGPLSASFFEKVKEGISRLPSGFEGHIVLNRTRLKPVASDSKLFPKTGFLTSTYLFEVYDPKIPIANGLAQIFHDLGMEPTPLTQTNYEELLGAYLGGTDVAHALPNLVWEGDHLQVSPSSVVKIASATDAPQHTWPGIVQCLVERQEEFIVSFRIRVPDRAKSRRDLATKRRVTHALSIRKADELSDLESGASLNSSEETLVRMTQGKECLTALSLAVIMADENLSDLERRIGEFASDATTSTGIGFFVEGVGTMPVFRSHLPGEKALAVRELTFLSANTAHLLPVLQDYGRVQTESCLTVTSRCFERSHLNFYSPNNLSFNALIAGTTGSGKSFLMNSLLLATREEHPAADIAIFDLGGSYRKVVEHLGGGYETLDADAARSLVLGQLRSRKVSSDGFSRAFFENLCGQGGHLTHSHRVAIEDLLNFFAGEEYQFARIAREAEGRTDRAYRDIALWLRPYLSWDKIPLSSVVSSSLVRAYDFKFLSKEPVLQRLAILVLTQDIWNRLEAGTAPKTLTIFDEVWRFFSHARDRLEEMYRVYRKYGASIACATQALTDYGDDAFAKLIFSLSYNRLLLQGAATAETLTRLLDASPSDVERFLSIASKKNEYSEFLHLTPKFSQILRLHASPDLYQLANSENINTAKKQKE